MKKRILIGGLHHESDNFNPIITGKNDIWVVRGNDIITRKGKSSIDGIVSELQKHDYEIIPTIIARAVPNGEWDNSYYYELKNELLDGIKNAGKLDALCLSLHGSMRVKDLGEAEGDLLKSIREIVGNDMPIYSTLDMHATVTYDMIKYCNGYVGYKCAPHTDTFETGEHAARMLIEVLENNIKGTTSCVRIPMLVAGEQSETSTEPMISMIKKLREYEKDDKVLACSYLLGFPWADTEENGITSIVVTKDDQKLADDIALDLAKYFWDKRREFTFYNETREPEDTLLTSLSVVDEQAPIVISDSGDNPTAGSSGDVTNFLRMILNNKEATSLKTPLVYQAIYDPFTVEKCFKAKIGDTIDVSLGACFDKKTSKPIQEKAKIISRVEKWEKAE